MIELTTSWRNQVFFKKEDALSAFDGDLKEWHLAGGVVRLKDGTLGHRYYWSNDTVSGFGLIETRLNKIEKHLFGDEK